MTHFKLPKLYPKLSLVLAAVWLTGCANLDHIHQFAGEAAKTDNSDIISENYVLSAGRQVDLVSSEKEKAIRQDRVAERKKLKARFDIIHATTVAYMKAIDLLATDTSIADNPEIASAATTAANAKVLTTNQSNLVGAVLNGLQKVALDGWRRAELSKLIKRSSTDFNKLLVAQSDVVDEFIKDLKFEREDTETHFGELRSQLHASDDRDQAILESLHYIEEQKEAEIDKELKVAQDYNDILKQILLGSQTLAKHVDDLTSDLVKDLISKYSANIQAIYKGMTSL